MWMPVTPPPAKQAHAEAPVIKPMTVFDDAIIIDPKKLKRPKVQTIGSMPVVLGIAELK